MAKKEMCSTPRPTATRVAVLLAGAIILALSAIRPSLASSPEDPVSCVRLIDYAGTLFEPLNTEPYGLNKVAIGSETRNALCLPVPGRLAREILLPEAPVAFDFGVGIRADMLEEPGASVRFSVDVETGHGDAQQVFARILTVKPDADEDKWLDCRVDLSAYARKRVNIVLATALTSPDRRAATSSPSLAAWSNPTVYRLDREQSVPNILIYLIDTLRADHLGVYGYSRDTSPNLDALARTGILFGSAFATSSWTRPSVASLFTSLYPSFHGAIGRADVMDDDVTTLSEILLREGYSTAAFVTNPNVLAPYGFAQGFETFGDIQAEQWRVKAGRASDLNRAAFQYLERHRDRKFFLYLHSNDPHHPYRPEEPYNRMFASRGDEVGAHAYEKAEKLPQPAKKRVWEALYDGEIRYNDEHVGDLLRKLKALGLFDNTLIVFVSDHGEEFLDHGGWQHGHTLFDELIRLMLIVKLPSSFARTARNVRIDSLVTVMDVMPTVLELLGIRCPSGIHGGSLLPLIRGDTGSALQQVICEQNLSQFALFAVRTPKHKYILRIRPNEERLLYDVEIDPRETKNLIDDKPGVADSFQSVVDDFVASSQGGVHLAFAGDGKDRAVSIRATTSGSFAGVRQMQCESEDTATLSEDDNEALVSLTVKGQTPKWSTYPAPDTLKAGQADTDEVILLISENTGSITLEISVDGNTIDRDCVFLGPDRKSPTRIPIHIERDALEVIANALYRPPEPSPKRVACYIWKVPPPRTKKVVELDEKTRKRLRALGYLE